MGQEPTLDEWKTRALKAERALFNVHYELCGEGYVYGDDNGDPDNLNGLDDVIEEAAQEAGVDLKELPVPENIQRRRSDQTCDVTKDRQIFFVTMLRDIGGYDTSFEKLIVLAIGKHEALKIGYRWYKEHQGDLLPSVEKYEGMGGCQDLGQVIDLRYLSAVTFVQFTHGYLHVRSYFDSSALKSFDHRSKEYWHNKLITWTPGVHMHQPWEEQAQSQAFEMKVETR